MPTSRKRFAATLAAGIALAMIVVACGGGGGNNGYPTGPSNPGGTGYSGGGGASGSYGSTTTIYMKDDYFDPQVDTVAVGDTVTWMNQGTLTHTTTSDTGLWDSGAVSPGQSYKRVFDTAGTFNYHCAFHVSLGMKGTIVVK